jgi:hypothetical protein
VALRRGEPEPRGGAGGTGPPSIHDPDRSPAKIEVLLAIVQCSADHLGDQRLEPAGAGLLQKVTEMDVLDLRAQRLGVEERERCQVLVELGVRLGQGREVDGLVVGGGGGEADLLRQDARADRTAGTTVTGG